MAEYKGKYKSVYTPGIEFESDYIAREVARDLMYHNQYPLTEHDLNDLPSADVRPVEKGRWVEEQPGPWGMVYATCSACKKRVTLEQRHMNFCPNCGADMRKGNEDG